MYEIEVLTNVDGDERHAITLHCLITKSSTINVEIAVPQLLYFFYLRLILDFYFFFILSHVI